MSHDRVKVAPSWAKMVPRWPKIGATLFLRCFFWLFLEPAKTLLKTVGFAMFCFTFLKISVEISHGEPQRCEERPKMSEKRRKLSEHRFRDARWAKLAPRCRQVGPLFSNFLGIRAQDVHTVFRAERSERVERAQRAPLARRDASSSPLPSNQR